MFSWITKRLLPDLSGIRLADGPAWKSSRARDCCGVHFTLVRNGGPVNGSSGDQRAAAMMLAGKSLTERRQP